MCEVKSDTHRQENLSHHIPCLERKLDVNLEAKPNDFGEVAIQALTTHARVCVT